MKLIGLILLFLPHFVFSQVLYNYTDNPNGIPVPITDISSYGLIRVNGAMIPPKPCSLGFSSKSLSKEIVFSLNQAAIEFSFSTPANLTATVTSMSAGLRRSGDGTINCRYAYSIDSGRTWISNDTDLLPKKADCGDTKTRSWTIKGLEKSGLVKFRVYGYNAKSASGILQILNIVISGTLKDNCNVPEICNQKDDNCNGKTDEGELKYYFDGNGDGYGDQPDNYIYSVCTTAPINYTPNLAPPIDLNLTNTNITIPSTLWGGTMADIFYTGNSKNCKGETRLMTSEPIYSLATGFEWNFTSFNEGVTTWWDAVRVGALEVLRKWIATMPCIETNYNCCQFGSIPIDGLCPCVCTVNDSLYDAFNDYVSFTKKYQHPTIITFNTIKGTGQYIIDQAKWKLDNTKPLAAMFCQECNSDGAGLKADAKKYLDSCKLIVDATKDYNYIKIGDAAQIWSDAKKNINWNKSILQSGLFDMFDMYLQLDEVTDFNGNIKHDTANLNLMPDTTMELFDKMDSMFHAPIALTQISTSEAFTSDTNDIVYPGQAMAGFAVAMYYETIFNYNIKYNNRVQIGIWQTIKNVTGKSQLDLNGNFLMLLKYLMKDDGTYLSVTEQSGLQIFGSKVGDEYRLIFLNKTGKELSMPKTLSLDGFIITNPNWSSGQWLYCDSFTTKETVKYDNTGMMKMGLGYCSVKIPKSN